MEADSDVGEVATLRDEDCIPDAGHCHWLHWGHIVKIVNTYIVLIIL
jgi:hypothetical protein